MERWEREAITSSVLEVCGGISELFLRHPEILTMLRFVGNELRIKRNRSRVVTVKRLPPAASYDQLAEDESYQIVY